MKIDFKEHDSISYRLWAPENPMFVSEKITNSKLLCLEENLYGIIKKHKYIMKNFIIQHMEWASFTNKDSYWYDWSREISWEGRMKENNQNDMWLSSRNARIF